MKWVLECGSDGEFPAVGEFAPPEGDFAFHASFPNFRDNSVQEAQQRAFTAAGVPGKESDFAFVQVQIYIRQRR